MSAIVCACVCMLLTRVAHLQKNFLQSTVMNLLNSATFASCACCDLANASFCVLVGFFFALSFPSNSFFSFLASSGSWMRWRSANASSSHALLCSSTARRKKSTIGLRTGGTFSFGLSRTLSIDLA